MTDLSAQICVYVCWLRPPSLVGERDGGRGGRLPALPSYTDQTGVSPPTCFSGRGPPLASFLRDLGAGLPQRVGVLGQPGSGAALVSAAESGVSTGSGEKGRGTLAAASNVPSEGAPGRRRDRGQILLF